MIDGIRFKVCGLTSIVDASSPIVAGPTTLGFIFHPKSPRFIPLAQLGDVAPAARSEEGRGLG